jgi:AcrR family transcriptional regulator
LPSLSRPRELATTAPTREQTNEEPRKPGRPRSEKARAAILEAAIELLLTRGVAAVSMDGVAERACVSKATIYRWWRTKETLVLDAVYHEWTVGELPDMGSLRGDLHALLGPWVGEVRRRPYDAVIAALIVKARTDARFAKEYAERLVEPRREHARTVFMRASERGEIGEAVEVELAIDLIYGPLYLRLLQGHAPLSAAVVRRVIDAALDGVLAGSEAETGDG